MLILRKVGLYLLEYRRLVMLVFLLIFIQALSQLYLPTLMGDIIDRGVIVGDIRHIWINGLWMLAVAAVGVAMSIAISHFSAKIAMSMGRDMRRDVFERVSDFSLTEFNEIGTASLITRTTNDVTQVQQATIMVLRMFLMAPFMLIGGLIMALTRDTQLALVILLAIPFIVLTIYIIMKRGYPLFKGVQKRLDRLNLVFRENLTGMRVIRSFAKGREERARLREANADLTDISIKVNRLMAFTTPMMMLLMNITVVLVIWFGGIRIEAGALQIGELMAYIQYVMLIMFALIMASMLFVILPRASVSANRIQEVLDLERVNPVEGSKEASKAYGLLEFDHVSFSYPGAMSPVLRDISFTVKPGEVTAIIGGTGSGKTTLINLIPRFYEITSGEIRINGVNIRETTVEQARDNIGLVSQKAFLFSTTVKENIRLGNENATDEEIIRVAKIAQAHDFIMELPEQYDTVIEQGGANLSGGQKQRLSIARALVRKPAIYIFDDSFSALDYKTDAKLRAALVDETKDSSMLVVAQRVSTVMQADQIIVLEKGQIVGSGTHEVLLANNSVYQEIVASQLGNGGNIDV